LSVKGKCKIPVLNYAALHENVLGEWRYSSTQSTTSTDGDERSASRHSRFTPEVRAPGTHWVGSWVGPRACLDEVMKRRVPSHCRNWNLRSYSP